MILCPKGTMHSSASVKDGSSHSWGRFFGAAVCLIINLYNINHPSPALSLCHGCFIHLYPISVLPTLALSQVDSLQKIVSATCESMTCLGDKKCRMDCLQFNRVYEAEKHLERVTWTWNRSKFFFCFFNFFACATRSLLSKQAEGLKDFEKDAWR